MPDIGDIRKEKTGYFGYMSSGTAHSTMHEEGKRQGGRSRADQ